jgi:hypothetical protein
LDRDLNSAQQKLHLNNPFSEDFLMFSHVFFHLMMEFEWGPVPVRSIAIQIASIPGGESGA